MKRPPPLTDDALRTALRAKGMSATPQRLAIARFVLESADHPTAEDVFIGVRGILDGISQATVYNSLHRLVECGIVSVFQRVGERVRYDGNTSPHHHFYDVETDTLIDLDPSLVHVDLDPGLLDEVQAARVCVVIEGRRRESRGGPAVDAPSAKPD